MELASLTSFIAIAESGSFSQAAQKLYITQPAVSKRIASLESHLGARLFDRLGRKVILTEAGNTLLPKARRILHELNESRQIIASLSSGTIRGRLSIATSHHIGLRHLPPVLKAFKNTYADVELDIHFMDSEQACGAIERGELELAVVTLPNVTNPAIETQLLWPDPLAIVVAPDHPLTTQKSVSLNLLSEYPAILPGPGTFTRRILEQTIQPKGLNIKLSLETNYLETIRMLVVVGLGWSALPQSMTGDDLLAIEVDGIHMQRELGLVRHPAHTLSKAAAAFIEVLKDSAAS